MTISSEAEARSFELAEAQIELQPFASVTVAPAQPFEQRLTVTRGAVRFQVAHDPMRRFVVTAGAVEVRDVGTGFTVAREGTDGDIVRVAVTSGEVEVRVGSRAPYSLHAGESLTTPEPAPTTTPPAATPGAGGSTAPNDLVPSAFPPEPPDAASDVKRAPSWTALGPTVDPVSAKSLLAEATAARRAGDVAAEAKALDALRTRFPRDPRAAIAAFELGIIRMDKLGTRSGALEAFRAAIAQAPGASFREDAEARIVILLDESHDTAGCRNARDMFLSHYPASVHGGTIQRRCQSR
jgi:hypothetical protein